MDDVRTPDASDTRPASRASAFKVFVKDVCRLAGDRQVSLTSAECQARKGPYPFHGGSSAQGSSIDDYAIDEGPVVMVGALGQVLDAAGHLCAALEEGRCSASDQVHALVPHDPADARYIWRALTTLPGASFLVDGTSQFRQLSGPALLAARIPWPCRSVRDRYVEALDELDEKKRALEAQVWEILDEGDAAFARAFGPDAATMAFDGLASWRTGTGVPASLRGDDKPFPVEAPRGELGRCDEALTGGPAVLVGSRRGPVARYVPGACHPLADVTFAEQGDMAVELPVLFFSLRQAGVAERPPRTYARATSPAAAGTPAAVGSPAAAGAPAGKKAPEPVLTLDDLPSLVFRVGTREDREAFAPVGASLLERLVETREAVRGCASSRAALVAELFSEGTVEGNGSCEGCGQAKGDVPEPRGASRSFDRAKSDAAKLVAGLPRVFVDDASRAALGPLAQIVERADFGLEAADLAWELGPLAVVRACAAGPDWDAVARAADEGCAPDHAALVPALDAAMDRLAQTDDLLSFMPNLSYGSSLLSPAQLAVWVRLLDASPALSGGNVRAAFALEPGCAGLPAEVAPLLDAVVSAVAKTLPEGFETAYVPCESCEGVVDALARTLPDVTLRAQFDEFSHMIAAAMVRAVGLRDAFETRGGLGAAAGSSLVADEFADWKAPLVVCALPPNQPAWTTSPVRADDPRWVLGTPPRSRANYAWLQHALWHQEEGGATVLLACDAVLHSATGCERELRRALVASGRVRLVASLPGRIFGDGRPATSLIVLGDPRPASEDPECLMVSALGLAAPNPDPAVSPGMFVGGVRPGQTPERVLPASVRDRLVKACAAWLGGAARPCEDGFARPVALSEVAANEDLLTPWSYV